LHVFRRPTDTINNTTLGVSQEKNVGVNNQLHNPCTTGGSRYRGIGTSEVMNGYKDSSGVIHGGILGSGGANLDGIAYTYWGFGNINKLWNSTNYSYLTLDGEDPIGPFTGTGGPWGPGVIPNCTQPCPETTFWSTTGSSFPSLRAGKYTAWALLHLVTAEGTYIEDMLTNAYAAAVNDEPDFIPVIASSGDPGVEIFKTHYQEYANGVKIGGVSNGTFSNGYGKAGNPPEHANDAGGDAGGCTVLVSSITSAAYENYYIQTNVTGSGPTCAKDRN
jgi:hypothetical protein